MSGTAQEQLKFMLQPACINMALQGGLNELKEYDYRGIFHKDPKGLEGFLATVHPSKPECLEHLLKQVQSERAMNIVQKVENMFAMAGCTM